MRERQRTDQLSEETRDVEEIMDESHRLDLEGGTPIFGTWTERVTGNPVKKGKAWVGRVGDGI